MTLQTKISNGQTSMSTSTTLLLKYLIMLPGVDHELLSWLLQLPKQILKRQVSC